MPSSRQLPPFGDQFVCDIGPPLLDILYALFKSLSVSLEQHPPVFRKRSI
jgi:hypothetical protein